MPGFGFKTKEQAQRVARAVRSFEGQSLGTEPAPSVRLNKHQRTGGVAKLTATLNKNGSAQATVQKLDNGALADVVGATITIHDCDTLDTGESIASGKCVFYRWIAGGYILDGWRCRDVS